MPSLFRFLTVCGVIAVLVWGTLFVLAVYFEPEPREITKPVRNLKPQGQVE